METTFKKENKEIAIDSNVRLFIGTITIKEPNYIKGSKEKTYCTRIITVNRPLSDKREFCSIQQFAKDYVRNSKAICSAEGIMLGREQNSVKEIVPKAINRKFFK